MNAWVSCFRMYSVTPTVKAAWSRLFGRLFSQLGLDVEIIDHAWPLPIESLWRRPDLLCTLMCGWPFINSLATVKPIAVPVPSPPRYQNQSRYCSEFLARAESGWTTLDEAFGHRFGYMTVNSQSGFNAPRGALAPFAEPRGGALFSAVKGPLDTPTRALAALLEGEVDLIALDSYFLDLLRVHRPEALRGVATLAATGWTPMPLLVAASDVSDELVARLADKLTGVHNDLDYSGLLTELLLNRFDRPDVESYRALNDVAAAAQQHGYGIIR